MPRFEQIDPKKEKIIKELEKRISLINGNSRSRISAPKPVRSKEGKSIPTLRNRVE